MQYIYFCFINNKTFTTIYADAVDAVVAYMTTASVIWGREKQIHLISSKDNHYQLMLYRHKLRMNERICMNEYANEWYEYIISKSH